ncbi:methyltransferase domain-containing protein [candidate division KSB1 bacterium]|nr:methyltransferase domain-containing protein [candidate division KSB1 bacterium]
MHDFDGKAGTWDYDPMKIERARVVAEAIAREVPLSHTMRALEYGCGTGLLSFNLNGQLGTITLADNSEGMLAVVRKKIADSGVSRMTPLHLDLAVDSLPPQRFDLIYTLMTLHHVENTDQLLRHFYELLDSPGYLCIIDLYKEDGSFHDSGFSGHLGFDQKELTAKLKDAGFSDVRFRKVYTIVRPARSYPLFLMVAEKTAD